MTYSGQEGINCQQGLNRDRCSSVELGSQHHHAERGLYLVFKITILVCISTVRGGLPLSLFVFNEINQAILLLSNLTSYQAGQYGCAYSVISLLHFSFSFSMSDLIILCDFSFPFTIELEKGVLSLCSAYEV